MTFVAVTVFLVGVASVYGAALAIVFTGASWLYAGPFLAATLFPLVLYASSNPRLFFLFGLAFTIPLGLSLRFLVHQHMGGEFAISVNLSDFFLLPLVVFLARDYYQGYRRDLRLSPVSGWWVGLIALGIYSVAVGPYREMSALEVIQMLKVWLIFLVIVNECVRERHFQVVVAGIGANLALNIVVAFLQYSVKHMLGLGPLGEPSDLRGADMGVYGAGSSVFRVAGLAGHPNLFGPYLAMGITLMLGILFAGYRGSSKVLAALVAAGGMVCLVLTLSRSGWASFAMAAGTFMMVLLVMPGLRSRYLGLKMALIGGGGVAAVAFSGTVLRRLFESEPGAFDFRIQLIKIAWHMVTAHPILGVGLNTFSYQLANYGPFSYDSLYSVFGKMFPVVHNVYMIVWAEQGTVGLFLFLAMHATILLMAVRNLRYLGLSDRVFMVSLCAGCGFLGLMVDDLSSFFMKVETFGRVYWLFVGLIVAAYYWNLRNDAHHRALAGGVQAAAGQARQ